MKVDIALQGVAKLFLDTAPVIYYVDRNPTYTAVVDEIFDRVDSGKLQAVTSPITLGECLVVPIRQGLLQVQQSFTDLIVSGAPGAMLSRLTAIAYVHEDDIGRESMMVS